VTNNRGRGPAKSPAELGFLVMACNWDKLGWSG